ncbi:MAG TPA: LPS-assembly protein LptD [Bacteroidetes bacterium]|nr:LPS-assembly protein LptD [Bacteroidota bacterium]
MKRFKPNILFILLVYSSTTLSLYARQAKTDTLKNYSIVQHTDLDTTIFYQAQQKEIDVKTKITRLIGQAEVTYRNMRLTAGLITIDWDKNLLIAETLPDSLAAEDSVRKDSSSLGYPTVTEGGQTMTGEKMFFNFKTKKARIIRGRTQFQEGYYSGKRIKKVREGVYYVKDGMFTTCDLDTPHYHFAIKQMEMIYKDKVIAKPVIFYIHNIPVAVLPFAVFPNRKGRHSGILVPRYGQSYTEGRYLRGLGYYWAASQYWDTKLEMDFFEKTGFMFHSTTNYAVRYLLRGTVSGSLLRKSFSGEKQSRWDLTFNHSQTLSQTMNISAYGSFVSDGNYYNDFSGNRAQRLQREMRSNATLTKSWPGSKNSVTVNVSRSQYLDTGSWRETLPQVNFRHGQEALINLFRSKKSRKSSSFDRHWYENIYFSLNSRMLNTRASTRSSKDAPFQNLKYFGMNHRITVNSPFRLFRYFTFSQNLSYAELWQDRSKKYSLNRETNRIESEDKPGFAARRTFNLSVSANTKIYGIFPVNRWSIIGFRHVITPNVSLGFQPDFSDPVFGYYQEIEDTTGRVYKRDRFTGGQFGATPSTGRHSLSFNVNNLFQMKRLVDGKEKKTDLFTYNLSSNYNFELDSLRFAPLSSSLRASPSRIFNFTINMSHTFYKYDLTAKRQTGQSLASENLWHPLRLTNLTLSSSLRLTNKLFEFGKKAVSTKGSETDTTAGEFVEPVGGNFAAGNRFENSGRWTSEKIPWTANFSFSYNERRFNPEKVIKSIWLNLDGNLKLTKKWRIQYHARMDLKKKSLISQDFRIYRDLHCWEASFTWTPTGPYKRYYLRINIKSSMLKDIKLEKRGGRGSIFGY